MTLLVVHAAATLLLGGLIWTIQLVHYPLMDGVGEASFRQYHERHTRRMTWLVAPLMPIELVTSALLLFSPPASVPPVLPWVGFGLVLCIWAATALLAVPAHRRLAEGFDPAVHARLVRGNWLRTIAWSVRGVLALWMLVAQRAA